MEKNINKPSTEKKSTIKRALLKTNLPKNEREREKQNKETAAKEGRSYFFNTPLLIGILFDLLLTQTSIPHPSPFEFSRPAVE